MRQLKSFGAFWYDFIIGDDWRLAAAVVAGLALTAILIHAAHVNAWWALPVFVFAALAWSLHRATTSRLRPGCGVGRFPAVRGSCSGLIRVLPLSFSGPAPGMLGRMGNGMVTKLAGGRHAIWYAAFALYAAGIALFSGPGLDHWWGAWAAGGYALAAVITLAASGRAGGGGLAIAASLAGALAAPVMWLMTREPTPPDVAVVARSGVLLHHGTPYLPVSALSAGGWLAYNPYLPVMALFGLPGALGLPGKTWPWLVAGTFLLLYATFRVTLAPGRAGRRDALGHAAFWLACPVMAFPLTMGITDPPVIALTCLALALLAQGGRAPQGRSWSRDTVLAAFVLGAACAMKYTAWPALAIMVAMVAARDGARSAVKFTAVVLTTAAGLVAALAPAALRHPASILQNTVAYPLGLTSAKSPAQSPLPGHLLATLGSGGHLAALVLLAAAGLATAASLVIAPPATPAAAARRIAMALTALFMLSPATRFGYFIYPIALYAWAVLASRAKTSDAALRPHRTPIIAARAGRLRGHVPAGEGDRSRRERHHDVDHGHDQPMGIGDAEVRVAAARDRRQRSSRQPRRGAGHDARQDDLLDDEEPGEAHDDGGHRRAQELPDHQPQDAVADHGQLDVAQRVEQVAEPG
ncbi:MAG: integral rane protein, partial [Actinomycetia bacterium]|nr:integral rane protein [Actinomycetes bacterium]